MTLAVGILAAALAVPNGLARDIADVEFVTPRVGFVTSTTGRIQRTRDGGKTWHDVWSGRPKRLEWVAFADRRHGFVGAGRFILRSSDGGATWRRSPMSVPVTGQVPRRLEPHFVTPSLGFAVTDPASFGGRVFARTLDGGLHWVLVPGLQTVGDVDFVSGRTGFALGRKLYRTDDGGATWRRLALPRVPYDLAAVDFLDAQRGFVAGGRVAMTEQPPAQALFVTVDGGRTWQRRFLNPHRGFSPRGGDPFARLHFVDARRGWATTGLCKCCPSGPCAGVIYLTRDGGRTWMRRGRREMQLSILGASEAWALEPCDIGCRVLLHTMDAGRSWRRFTGR